MINAAPYRFIIVLTMHAHIGCWSFKKTVVSLAKNKLHDLYTLIIDSKHIKTLLGLVCFVLISVESVSPTCMLFCPAVEYKPAQQYKMTDSAWITGKYIMKHVWTFYWTPGNSTMPQSLTNLCVRVNYNLNNRLSPHRHWVLYIQRAYSIYCESLRWKWSSDE